MARHWGVPRIDSIVQDFRYGTRQLRRTPIFTAAATLTLGLTIGSTAALFAIVNAVVLRPLPYPDSERIMSMTIESDGRSIGRMDVPTASIAMRSGTTTFESVAAYDSTAGNLTGGDQPERVSGALVSASFFDVMGVAPTAGRGLARDQTPAGGMPEVVLSQALWQRTFGTPAERADRVIRLDDVAYRVVGMMPAGFRFPGRAEYWRLWVPRGAATNAVYYTDFIGRLKPGISPAAARDELYSLRSAYATELPSRAQRSTISVVGLHESLRGGLRSPLVLLFGIISCVLLIACANIASLLLARSAERRRELSLRTALGADRLRLVRQLLIESVLVAVTGAVPGVLIAEGGLRIFKAIGPANVARLPGIEMDATVLLFTLAVTLGVGFIFGIAPAMAAGRVDPQDALKATATAARNRSYSRQVLVILELATAVVLTIGAALLAKSFVRYADVERGFDAERVLIVSVPLPRPRYSDPAARADFSRRTLDRLRNTPGVLSATHAGGLPDSMVMTMSVPARLASGKPGDQDEVAVSYVGADYFRTFGIPLGAGTECPRDGSSAAVVSDNLARLFFKNRPALGESLDVSGEGSYTVVGVASNVRSMASNMVGRPHIYVCSGDREPPVSGYLAVRLRQDADQTSMIAQLRDAVRAADPSVPLVSLQPLSAVLGQAVTDRWFDSALIGAFAAIAIVLAVLGLYALISYLVVQRTREIGVRMALGATRTEVVRLVLRQGFVLTVIGVGLGLAAAVPLVRYVRSMLFGVEPLDAGMFVSAALVLSATAVASTAIPAWRAMRVDPIVALRSE